MVDDEIVDGEEGQEVSSQQVGEISAAQQDIAGSGEVSEVPTQNFDLNIVSLTGNDPLASSDSILGVNKKEAIENMQLMDTKGELIGEYECGNVTAGS
ncbi:hypothetical protein A4A49_65162, partial [Nicotiana attenuata]